MEEEPDHMQQEDVDVPGQRNPKTDNSKYEHTHNVSRTTGTLQTYNRHQKSARNQSNYTL